ERSEQLGQDGGGAAAVAAGVRVGQIPGESFGEHGGGLVGVGGAAVQVEVVHRVGVADAHDDVVGVGRAESGSRRADDHHGGPPGQRVQAQRLGDRAHHGAGLAGAGRSDGEEGRAEQVGAEGEAAAAVDVRVAGVVGGGAQAHLPGDQVVPGLPGGQVAGARGVRAGGGAVLEHGTGEGGQVVAAGAHALPGAGDPGVVDVAHQSGAGVGGEAFGGVGGSGGAELRP